MGKTNPKAICILGMHRSGTSAIARAVNLVGAYIGREDQLMPAAASNPDGFWEHMDIYSLHERLLGFLSHSWDACLPMPGEWWKRLEIIPYRQELVEIIKREFSDQPLWMWKDPRTCILLPLWKEVLYELKIDVSYLICIRNPLDVAASLKSRDDFAKVKSLALWHLYNLSLCYWTEGCKHIVAHYDDFLEDWESSLRKIAASLDIPWPREDNPLRSAMADFLKPSSRHSHSALRQLEEDRDVPEAVVSLYRLLLESREALSFLGSMKSKMSKPQTDYSQFFHGMYTQTWGEQILGDKIHHIQNLEAATKDKDAQIANLERVMKEKDTHIANLDVALKDREAQIGSLRSALEVENTHIVHLERVVKEKEATLNSIYHSYGLGALWICNKMMDKLFPVNSKRRLFGKLLLNTAKDPKAVFKTLNKKSARLFIYYIKTASPAVLEERAETLIFKRAILMYCDKVLLEPEHIETAGWAISTMGIERIEIYCDDKLLGHASYGRPRPDVHAIYPFIADSDNSGFSFSMPFKETLSSGGHTLLIKAIAKDGQSIEARHPIDAVDAYGKYLTRTAPTESTLHWMEETSKDFLIKPQIGLALVVKEESLQFLNRSLDSIKAQSYPFWNIRLFYEKQLPQDAIGTLQPLIDEHRLDIYPMIELNTRLTQTSDEFLGFISSGDSLMPHALFEMVKMLNMNNEGDLIYTDEDVLIDGQRREPFFKPDWSPDLLFSMNYIGPFSLLRKNLFVQVGGLHYAFSNEAMYDLSLRVTENTKQIVHVPQVLYTQNPSGLSSLDAKKIIEDSLSRRAIKGEVAFLPRHGTYRVKRAIIGSPKVSIIIITANKKPDLLKKCLKSIAEKTTYTNYEIVLMDHSNGRLPEEEIKRFFSGPTLEFVRYKGDFNFSRMNNLAVKKATGDYFLFLNDDTEVITSEWIEAILEHAQRTEVGVVGAKLLYPDGTIQHAGVFLVDQRRIARHAFRFLSNENNSYRGFAGVIRNCSAVTFACAMVSREVFSSLQGLDENLRVEWNDIDFCLRANEAGYLVVWTPFSLLYHAELSSREEVNIPDERAYFLKRWRSLLETGDPYYNANLTLDNDDFSLDVRSAGFRNLISKEEIQQIVSHARKSMSSPTRPHVRKGVSEKRIMIDDDSCVSVIIPTFNGAKDLSMMLPKLMSQKGMKSIEIVTVDSGSSDSTIEVSKRNGAKVVEIPPKEFSHSYSRNLGAEKAVNKYLLFMVQDALPSSELFIYHMLRSLKKHAAIAASCGEFLRTDTDLFGEVQQWGHDRFLGMGGDDKVLSLPEEADYVNLRKNSQLSDVACLIEKEVFLQYRYRNDYAEDLDLGLRLIRDHYKLVHLNTTKVIHSHTRPAYYILKRSLVDNTVLSKLFLDFPRPKIDSKMFCEDIMFMYNLVEEIVSKRLMRLTTPSSSDNARRIVMEGIDAGFGRRYPVMDIIEDAPQVDSDFSTFIRKINRQYDPGCARLRYQGKLLGDVKGYVNMVFDYVLQTSETIDDYRKGGIISCLYKILAIVVGTHLAFFDYSENPGRREFFVQLRNELEKGV